MVPLQINNLSATCLSRFLTKRHHLLYFRVPYVVHSSKLSAISGEEEQGIIVEATVLASTALYLRYPLGTGELLDGGLHFGRVFKLSFFKCVQCAKSTDDRIREDTKSEGLELREPRFGKHCTIRIL